MQYVKIRNIGKFVTLWVVTLVCLSFWVTPARADEESTAARKIINKWQDVVITVKLTIEQRMVVADREMSKSESKAEATAVVIDRSGLAVLSLHSIDPTGLLSNLMSGSQFGGEDMPKFKWESEVTGIKILLPDGKEVSAKIVLRDKDLGLAFVRPEKKLSKPITALDLSNDAKPEILDQVVIMSRLGKVANRVPSVSLSRIQAIVKKPRTFYVPGSTAMEGGLGAPVFSLDGKVVGIVLLRTMKSPGIGIGSMFGGMSRMGMLPIILPAKEIKKVAKQAPK